ncbi:hypothetical protein IF1G_01869 [Cordyceps javanica]|uniref:Uncharacterized protein n=1 Tax=Cordyceps javanica TaxID=43265 RepID=A0A545VD57_9HYPO|nr:hypothetical protein IF1G_01869 [Cordyceps javanica]
MGLWQQAWHVVYLDRVACQGGRTWCEVAFLTTVGVLMGDMLDVSRDLISSCLVSHTGRINCLGVKQYAGNGPVG